jgi:hypothetical protein
MRVVRRLVVAVMVASFVTPAAIASPKPKTTHTAAGSAAAQHALIASGDLGPGWTAGATPAKPDKLTCGETPSLAGVVETGAAVSPTFRAGASGPFVSQAAFVYGTASQAAALWRHVAGPNVLACLARSVADGGAKGVRFAVLRREPLSRPAAGARSSAFRVIVQAKTKAQKVTAYVDMVLLGRGNAVTALSFASFTEPVDTTLELSLARIVARRL